MKPFASFRPDAESREILRKRTFRVQALDDIPDILDTLKSERFTGSVSFHLSQGTCASIAAEERARIAVPESFMTANNGTP